MRGYHGGKLIIIFWDPKISIDHKFYVGSSVQDCFTDSVPPQVSGRAKE